MPSVLRQRHALNHIFAHLPSSHVLFNLLIKVWILGRRQETALLPEQAFATQRVDSLGADALSIRSHFLSFGKLRWLPLL